MPKIQLPVIGYMQGGRRMMTTAMCAPDLVSMVSKPAPWNPAKTDAHGNRPRDTTHLKAIVNYLEGVEDFVLGAAVLYLTSREAHFEPVKLPGVTTDFDAAQFGVLSIDISAKFDIGDGQHRIGAYEHIVQTRDEEDDPVITRLRDSGQPLIIVIDDDHKRRAQDFADLQRNVKAPTQSLGQSMDRRQPINRALSDLFDTVPLFEERVEYLKDNPGKLSAKLFSFKTIRYVSGLLLVGNKYRSPSTMDKAVTDYFEHGTAEEELTAFWTTLGDNPRFADVIDNEVTAAEVREATYLTSAGVLYAIAFAVFTASALIAERLKGDRDEELVTFRENAIEHCVRALDDVDFSRVPDKRLATISDMPLTEKDSIFAGNLIDPISGKLVAGRTAWEAAAAALARHIAANEYIREFIEAQ
ncbi:DNA sulfur modification protein DndB [Kitasatospora sp. NPDC089509]|uniref:DNA sulfur modification protein DndB n=1 Tax=Kitasatospora sp. NPDC089509 TaxID=3364079 RepID=UPI00382DA1CE